MQPWPVLNNLNVFINLWWLCWFHTWQWPS